MDTGSLGTFVISWSQTELDGLAAAPLTDLRPGAVWRWSGTEVRVDGPRGVLALGEAIGEGAVRARAAKGVRRLLSAVGAGAVVPARDEGGPLDAVLPDPWVEITDGRRAWTLTLVPTDRGRLPLVMVLGTMPPADRDLWVVSHGISRAGVDRLLGSGPPGAGAVAGEEASGGIVCFTPGTMILTAAGACPVEDLRPGIRVQTKDDGAAEVLWIGHRRITGARMRVMPHLAPVRFASGSLDRGVPEPGLLVSPDHRVVLTGPRARALFGEDEVLVAARDLVNGHGIQAERGLRDVAYIHLLLPRHAVIYANGVETDSFHPAAAALDAMEEGARDEMLSFVPDREPAAYGEFARRMLTRAEAAILANDLAA